MTESEATAAATPAKKAKKPKAKPTHPKTSVMVLDAITALKDRKGSSLAAIKKHIAANHKVDAEKLAPFIRKYLKKAVTDGVLAQTKGTGANGSFKLAAKAEKPKAAPKKAAAKKAKAPAKKSAATKKAATPKKKKTVKKTATKSKKEKKPAKSPKKPKAPKPKKAASKPKAKKPAPKKK